MRLGKLFLEDFMWRAVGSNYLVHSPLFLAMINVAKEMNRHAIFRISTPLLCSISWKSTSFTARTWYPS